MLKNALKFIGTLILLWVVWQLIDPQHALTLLSQVNGLWVAAALGLMILSTILSALRWQAVALKLGLPAHLPYHRLMWLGAFFSQLLPTGMGGDAIRALALRDYFNQGAMASILFERGVGLLLHLIITLCGLPFLYLLMGPHPLFWALAAVGLGGVASGVGYICFGEKLPLQLIPKLGPWLQSLAPPLRNTLLGKPYARIWLSSIGIQIIGGLQIILLAHALGIAANAWGLFILFSPLVLLMVLPLSVGGWGLREGAMIVLFTTANLMNTTEAATLSILYGLCMIIAALPGALFLRTLQR